MIVQDRDGFRIASPRMQQSGSESNSIDAC